MPVSWITARYGPAGNIFFVAGTSVSGLFVSCMNAVNVFISFQKNGDTFWKTTHFKFYSLCFCVFNRRLAFTVEIVRRANILKFKDSP